MSGTNGGHDHRESLRTLPVPHFDDSYEVPFCGVVGNIPSMATMQMARTYTYYLSQNLGSSWHGSFPLQNDDGVMLLGIKREKA